MPVLLAEDAISGVSFPTGLIDFSPASPIPTKIYAMNPRLVFANAPMFGNT